MVEPTETPKAAFGPGIAEWRRGAPSGPPAAPRDAATVMILRESFDELTMSVTLEVYLVRREQRLAFMGGAHVFPGGRVDAKDPNPEAAAVREVEEEVKVRLDVRGLHRWARWITPVVEPKRFDALFFVAALPPGEVAEAVPGEVVDGLWVAPEEAIRRASAGDILLPPPTLWNLRELAALTTMERVFADAAQRVLADHTFEPRALEHEPGKLALVLRGDPAYDDPTAKPPPEKQRRFVLEDGRWLMRP